MANPQATERLHVRCPSCRKQLNVPASAQGKSGKCPGCGKRVRIPHIDPSPPIKPDSPARHTEQPTQHTMSAVTDTAEIPVAPPQVYRTNPERDSQPSGGAPSRLATSSPRGLWLLVYYSFRLGVPFYCVAAAAGAAGMESLAAVFGILVLVSWIYPPFPQAVASLIMSLLVGAIRCPGCGFEMDAVGRWTIGNYTDHVERHVYLAKNPIENSQFGHTDCPQCGATIRVR